MPSSDSLQECRRCNQPAHRCRVRSVSGGRPVLQALRSVIFRGVQIVCDTLKGADLNDEDAESPSHNVEDSAAASPSQSLEDSTADRMFYSCYESLEDISWGEERPQSGTELRTSTPVRNVFLPESRGDVHIATKLRAVRQAFQIIAHDTESRNFLKEAGLSILNGLLSLAGKKTEGLAHVWGCLMAFAESSSNWGSITEECQRAGVQTVCFYDLFYEAIVLRLLECCGQEPPELTTTLRTPWLSCGMKRTTVMFHAWARIRRDRELLTRPQGLYHHLCEMMMVVRPQGLYHHLCEMMMVVMMMMMMMKVFSSVEATGPVPPPV
ncbi:mitoguardin-like [Sardina pilchardus]|uniref:mitoguardin-like n=1 Tax=Sardina pilchardus TaxID=27697 RepID=UPI002E0DA409